MRHALSSAGLLGLVCFPMLLACGGGAFDAPTESVDSAADEVFGAAPPLAVARHALSTELALELPAPTGRFAVGARDTFVEDPSRSESATGGVRTLPIRVWYPACHAQGAPEATYASALVQPALEAALGVPSGFFDLDVHARQGAPMRSDYRGVILVSAGAQEPVAFQTGHAIDLASRGWVVVAIDHPHDTLVVEQPDGTLIPGELSSLDAFEPRVSDVGVVLAHLATLVPGWKEEVPVGMFGHSLGGAVAAEALLLYPELQAGVDLDGSVRGSVLEAGLDEPFGGMLSTIRELEGIDDGIDAWFAALRGPHELVQLEDVYHDGFSDFVVFNPLGSAFDPALGAALESVLRTDVPTFAAGAASLEEQRRFLGSFFARHLARGR